MERFTKRPAGFSSEREDLISKLPDDLIPHILLYLPTKEAVRTSVLSNRWKRVWLLIPALDLNTNEFPSNNVLVGFMEKFLHFSELENSCLHKVKLSIDEDDENAKWVTRWIDYVVTHKLKHLDVECLLSNRKFLVVMPLSLYTSQTLITLRLHRVRLGSFESVSLPCLKTMHLQQNVYANETCLTLLISSCPVLEDLSIVNRDDDNVDVLRVISQSLTSLSVTFGFDEDHSSWLCKFIPLVLIDAPRLTYFKFLDERSRVDSLAKVEVVRYYPIGRAPAKVGLSPKQMARSFFSGISTVRHMIISYSDMSLICFYLKEEPSTQFSNLSCLEAQISYTNSKILSTFLESCPNLKSLVVSFYDYIAERRLVSFSSVPQCLLSSLEFVEIKSRFGIRSLELGVAKYFVKNSVVLKKLVVHLSLPMDKKTSVDLETLLALRRSSICEIVHVADS